MKRWLLAAVLVASIAAFVHEPGFAASIQKPDQVMTVQQSVVDFPEIGQVTIRTLRSRDGFAAFTFSDARGNLLYKRVESERDPKFSSYDAAARRSAEVCYPPRMGFRVVDGPTAGSKMVFLATRNCGSGNFAYGTLVGVHKGALRVLLENAETSKGGMYVGDLGKKRGWGFAAWSVVMGDDDKSNAEASRLVVELYRFDQEAGQMVKIAGLKTKNKYGDNRKAPKELGMDYPDVLQTIPTLRCYFLDGNWRCDG